MGSFKMFNPNGLYFERVGQNVKEYQYIQFRKRVNKIGRSAAAEVFLNSIHATSVSREQLVVEFINDRMYISNLSKTNMTYLNDDQVIHRTEVEEGDLIGFGVKPNVVYSSLSEEQMFIYECKSWNKSKQKVIILDDSDDDDDVQIIDQNEIVIEAPVVKQNTKLTVEHPQRSITSSILAKPSASSSSESNFSLHIDTVESINDLSSSESKHSEEEDENSSDHVIRSANMLSVKIIIKKLTDEELEQWRPKLVIESSESDSDSEQYEIINQSEPVIEDTIISSEKQPLEKKEEEVVRNVDIPERRDSEKDKVFLNGLNFSKSKFDNLAKSLEMREKIRSLVDNDDSDDGLFSNLPKKSSDPHEKKTKAQELDLPQIDTKVPETIEKANRRESLDKIRKSVFSLKRRMSTNENNSKNKKSKLDEPTTTKKMYKSPGTSTNTSIAIKSKDKATVKPSGTDISKDNADKPKDRDAMKRRSSLHEMKKDDSTQKESNRKIFNRRMSLCPTSAPKVTSPCVNVKKKKLPPRRQTISESRFTEFDMFSKASELRMKKFGPTGKPNDANTQKEVPKKPEVANTLKKTQNRDDIRVDKNIVNQEVKKILDPILNRVEPKLHPKSANKTEQPINNDNKKNSSKKDQIDDIKKASLVKIKFTPVTRGECLTEAIPISRTKPIRRLSTFIDKQPSTSKDAMTVATFYDKYVKPNDVPIVNKEQTIDQIPEEVIDSLNAKINMEMKKQHEQLAVETTITINEQESPYESSSDGEELNLETDDEMDNDDETLGFYTLIDPNTPQNEIPSPFVDPNIGSPMKDDPRGKTKWVTSKNKEEPIEKTVELQKFPKTPCFVSTIHVNHEKPIEDIKKILKPPAIFISPSKQANKKRVSFNEFKLFDIVRYGIDDTPISTCKQQVAHVPPMKALVKNPKFFENAACAELMEWDWKWITLNNELPEGWKIEPHKHTYKSLQEYKDELKTVMKVELLKKLSSKYKTIANKEKVWSFMTVKERKDDENNHIKLVLGCDSKDLKQGTMLLLKVRDTDNVTRKPIDIHFFGYITAVNDRGELKLSTYCKELRREKAVLKSTCLVHLRSDIKLFAVLNCIQDTPFMKLFLNPSLNKMDRYEGMTSVSLEFKMTSIKLCPEQRTIIKKLSFECTKNEEEKIIFINGGAGTGKTYMMLAAVLNLKFCLKEKRRYLICTSTLSGLDEITETLYNMPHSSALNIVRIGYREKFIGNGRKLDINEQVQQRLNNGANGKSYKEIQKEIIENADIILSTVRTCFDLFDYQLSIDACFIDEANFAIDAELMILVLLNIKKMIFVGDEYQLEPTQSLVYKETRSNDSYFNRTVKYYKSINFVSAPVFTLLTQHRMDKDLFYICNKHVYNDSMTYNSINSMSPTTFQFKPFSVFRLDVPSNDQKYMNDEINYFCMKLCEILPKNVSIGIVNGFPSQRDKSRIKLETNDRRIECLAVETIQGIEKDVIILTLRDTETSFIHNFNRINVAMTRARKALYICSNMNKNLCPNEAGVFLRLKDDASNRNLYHVIQKSDFDRLYSMLRK